MTLQFSSKVILSRLWCTCARRDTASSGHATSLLLAKHGQCFSTSARRRRAACTVMYPYKQISCSNEKRSWLLAATGMTLRSGRRAAHMRILWGTGDHLSLDWELVSWFFNLKRPTKTHTDVPCTLLYVCTRLPSHFKNKLKK